FKFEDCSFITLENVSASNNKTDGMAFINCTEITYNGGFANDNGEALGDNGAEFVKCTNFTLNDFSANDNYDKGIYLGTRYTGQYQYDWTNPANSLRNNDFIGMCADVAFETVSADGNLNGDGLNIVHTSFGTFNNLSMTNNVNGDGLNLDASHHLTFTGGVFDNNNTGILCFPEDHDHTPSHNIAQEEITSLIFQGTVSASNNTLYGIEFLTGPDVYPGPPVLDSPDPKIVEPFFNGDFSLFDNGVYGMVIEGKVIAPSFYGLYFKDTGGSAGGCVIGTEPLSGNEPEDILINNSIFEGYASIPGHFAISLADLTPATKDVDAQYNIFAGATVDADVENVIIHQVDDPTLGLVNFSGWTSGKSVFYIGSESAYTGSMVTIPVVLNQPVYPETFNELKGTLDYNGLNLAYRYATTGTGTLLHDAGWTVIFDNSVSDHLGFWAIGFNAISTSGTLFYLTFEVIDTNDGAETVSCDPLTLYADNVNDLFVVHDGTINYTANASVSLVRGDATLDFAVDLGDYIAVVNHINGNLLTGQGLLNADANNDGFVNALDAAAILAFIDHGVWPNAPASGDGNLLFASATVDQNGLLRFPFTISQATDVRSFEIELTYDESKVDFRNYVQLLSGDNYRVDATKVADGKARFIFTASDESDGYLVPAEIMFNIQGDPNSQITIHSQYSINGGEFKAGPDYTSNGVTGVENEELPENFSVSQNYPNPFNPSTFIDYQIPEKGFVSIKIYDILGRLVKTLVNTELDAGYYKTQWNSVDNFGRKVSSGIYLYRVENGANTVTKKMVLLK
ncbi:MAG: T9SS type A sorting domain-containing protein, partial [Chlorobi bacterium]|nr:T9SS type A sorting domain-containing protein [Chlorobiota bacterium]